MRKVVTLIIIGLIIGLSASAFGAETIKIGALMSLTGGLAPYGPPIVNGAKLAVEQINAAGGILGRQVELVVRDTATSPDVGRDAARKLVELDRVPAIVGALSSGVTIAASSVTIPADVVLISPSSTSPGLAALKDNDYVFRTVVSDAMQGGVLARLALLLGYKKVSIIYVNNAYGKGLDVAFKNNFEKFPNHGVVAEVPYEENKASYRGEVEKAMRGNPDAILFISYPVDGNKQIVEAVEAGYQGHFLFPDGMKGEGVAPGPACQAMDKPGPIEGAFGTAAGAPKVAVAAQFNKDFAAKFGPTSVPYNTQAYDAVAVIALAAARAIVQGQPVTGETIRNNLRAVANPPGEVVTYNEFAKAFKLIQAGKEINYEGVSGPVDFDKAGDMAQGVIEVWKIQGCHVINVGLAKVP